MAHRLASGRSLISPLALYPIMKSVFSLAARRTRLPEEAPKVGAAPVS
jgi:hypothetical protein